MPTNSELMRGFDIGPWTVLPDRGLIRNGETEQKLEPLVMDVFVILASRGGEVVTKDELVDGVWEGRPQTDDVITRCIAVLRRALDDNARSPTYIETVQRRGYRIMLPVTMPELDGGVETKRPVSRRLDLLMIGTGLAAVLVIAWFALWPDSPTRQGRVKSIAVFPFECLHDVGEGTEHLCFGFAEEAVSSLKRIDGMRIVRFRQPYGGDRRIRQDRIVTGSVQIIGDQVKISVQVEESRNRVVTWSETYDSNRNGIFDLQARVADGLRGEFDEGFEVAGPTPAVPSSYAAAEAYALGRYLYQRRDHQSSREAIQQFEKAISIDPTYGPAWLGLAYTYVILPDFDLSLDRGTTYEKALEIIERGVEEDPDIRESAGTVYGFVYHKRNLWAEAVTATEMAVNAETAGAEDYNWHSRVLASVGRLDDALAQAKTGLDLDPDYAVIVSRVAIASLWLNDVENAGRYFDMANAMGLEASIHSLAYSLFLLRKDRTEEAISWARAGLDKNNVDSSWVGSVLEGITDPEKRATSIEILRQASTANRLPENVEMTMWALLGETDRAMAVARQLESGSGSFEVEIVFLEEFKAFRQHPEFEAFVDAIGLTDYWESAGCRWSNDRILCGS